MDHATAAKHRVAPGTPEGRPSAGGMAPSVTFPTMRKGTPEGELVRLVSVSDIDVEEALRHSDDGDDAARQALLGKGPAPSPTGTHHQELDMAKVLLPALLYIGTSSSLILLSTPLWGGAWERWVGRGGDPD